MKARNVADRILDDPRGRSEAEWLDVLDYLVSRLSDATGACLEIGRYWIDDTGASASICVCIRAKAPLPGVDSDCWEAVACLSGQARGAWADAYAFPFLRGSAVTAEGRIADLGPDVEFEDPWTYRFAAGEFQSQGWWPADGPGEWAGIKAPGDEYMLCIDCRPVSTEFSEGEPIYVDLRPAACAPPHTDLRVGHGASNSPRISLVYVERNREGANLVPWGSRPARSNSQHAETIDRITESSHGTLRLDLSAFQIRGGWIPSKYHVSVRVQNFHEPDSWSWTSEVSVPLEFTIR